MSIQLHSPHPTLRGYYAYTCLLEDYLTSILPAWALSLPSNATDPLRKLVSSVTVASQLSWDQHPKLDIHPAENPIEDVITRAQKRVLSWRKPNVLTLGYERIHDRSSGGGIIDTDRARKAVWTNSSVTLLSLSRPWSRLHAQIGDEPLLQLLTLPSLFVDVGNSSLTQLTGEPISELPSLAHAIKKRKREHRTTERPVKRIKVQHYPVATTSKKTINRYQERGPREWPISDIPLPRSGTFYAHPSRRPDGKIQLGFSQTHPLNIPAFQKGRNKTTQSHASPRGSQAIPSTQSIKSDETMQLDERSRRLAKHVFPREYGLPSVFYSINPRNRPNFDDRERDIQSLSLQAANTSHSVKTPKRVKPVLRHLSRMLYLHSRFDYRAWCSRICPSKLDNTKSVDIDEAEIPETSFAHIVTQDPHITMDVSHPSLIVPHGALAAQAEAQAKPRFAEYSFSHSEVHRYVMKCVKEVIPHPFWGNGTNFNLISSNVRRLIQARRHESMSLHDVLQGFRLSDCNEWLDQPERTFVRQTPGVTDALKRQVLLEQFIFWFFESFVLSLIKTTFYATESSVFKNQVLYFRHDDWDVLCKPLIDRLAANTFSKLSDSRDEMKKRIRERKLPHSFVRLLPKETGVRPIVNLSRKSEGTKSINQILQATFRILQYEKTKQPNLLGATVWSHSEMYIKMKAFKESLRTGGVRTDSLYFVKVDVRACFDTIDQQKLMEILRALVRKDRYTIVKYGQLVPKAGDVKRTFQTKARAHNDNPTFTQYAKELAECLRYAVFSDKVKYDTEMKESVLNLLGEHITDNIVKLGGAYYKQTIGIPQGSILSALLCSFFYGDLEDKQMNYSNDPGSMLLRWIDDYLLVTTDKRKAQSFLHTMNKGHPEYGCFISKEKTLTNFWDDTHHPQTISPNATVFPWCGLLLGTKDLDVSVDYSTYVGKHIADHLTVSIGHHPASAFEYRLSRMVKLRNHPLFCDPVFNTPQVAQLNIFRNFLLTAIKMHHYLKTWGLDVQRHHRYIWGIIKKSTTRCSNAISNRLESSTGRKTPYYIDHSAVTLIGYYAFHTMLSQKPTVYTGLLKDLESAMRMQRYHRTRKFLEPLLKQHAHDLDWIQW